VFPNYQVLKNNEIISYKVTLRIIYQLQSIAKSGPGVDHGGSLTTPPNRANVCVHVCIHIACLSTCNSI
jgi:hypothetical protein